ncbi:glycosyltransferase [Urechidicola sp. KH5]
MKIDFSIIVPVYNRPQEIEELLYSFTKLKYHGNYELIIVEDGSIEACKHVVERYQQDLPLNYFVKENTGAGDTRNFGMQKAKGNYFVILDSDVLVPHYYLSNVHKALEENYTDGFGGADSAHISFSILQKAINYSMTSLFTTGGIRGKKKSLGKFQPRSFNMGISRKAFEVTQGYSKLKFGEDIDLSFRMWEAGFKTQFISNAYVYHKRRTSIKSFYRQTFNFGTARPNLNRRYPDSAKLTYWFPSAFILGLDVAIISAIFGFWQLLLPFTIYFSLICIDALIRSKSLLVALTTIVTTYTQFLGYGLGFLKSQWRL